MAVQIQLRNGTAAQWTSANPILAVGEVGVETDTNKFKVGDGSTSWSSLLYVSGFDSAGNLVIGTTSYGLKTNRSMGFQVNAGCAQYISHSTADVTGSSYVEFGYNATKIGSITQNATTAVAYNTSSDYRLKNTIAPITGALAKVAQLKPVTYKWNSDNSDGEGFIAHELAEVCPHAVTGKKDAVDAAGNPEYQGIDVSFLVATLTAAIQEQQVVIQALTDRVAQLEAK